MGRPFRLEKKGRNFRLREVWGLSGVGRKPVPPVEKKGSEGAEDIWMGIPVFALAPGENQPAPALVPSLQFSP